MKNEELTLEIFRKNDLAYYTVWINYENYSLSIPLPYQDYYNNTLKHFDSSLFEFENLTINPVAYNANLLQIYTNFFACLEQFISTLYIILYFYKVSKIIPDEKNSIELFRQKYTHTINTICEIIEVDKKEFYKTGFMNKIAELEDARNYILHGNIGRIKISKTKLPEVPLTINYEDILEELDIIINVINYFRYIIPHIDLMPQISFSIYHTVIFRPLDAYFYNVLVPYVHLILNKHSLVPTRNYGIKTIPLPSQHSSMVKKIAILINSDSNELFKNIPMNPMKTRYYFNILENFLDKNHIEKLAKEGKFELPKFMIS